MAETLTCKHSKRECALQTRNFQLYQKHNLLFACCKEAMAKQGKSDK
jgi:hypothetical protein